jgi:hypothetical protein
VALRDVTPERIRRPLSSLFSTGVKSRLHSFTGLCQAPAWGDFKDRAKVSALVVLTVGRAVEIPIGGLDQPRNWVVSVRAVEAVQCRQFPA